MEGNTKGKGKVGGPALEEGQSWAQKPFQVWQKPYHMTLGDAAGASSSPDQAEKNITVENPPIGSVVCDAATDDFPAKPNQTQAAASDLGLNYDPNLDPKKLKRIMANRLSAQRSRQKKMQYLANLEMQARAYQAKIDDLQPQLASYQKQKQFLMLEHQTLDNRMAALKKETLLKDAEIEKNKAERNRLRELHMIQEGQLQAQILFNWDNGLQPMSIDPISNYYPNSDQVAQNGEDTLYMKVDIPQEQSQMPPVPDETLLMLQGMETNLISITAWNPNHSHHLP